jgi:tRNA A-37 threonylcarbamoyl transferase component Bud32
VKANLRFDGKVVRKTGNPAFLRVEYEKTVRAHELGEQSGLFSTPRALRFDAQKGMLEFERVDGLKPLGQVVAGEDPRTSDLLRKAGRVLAAIHAGLLLPDDLTKELPGGWRSSSTVSRFLHGDFTLANVCIQEPTGRLVVLDWSSAPIYKDAVTVGPVSFDILWFLYNLFEAMPLKLKHSVPAAKLASAFYEGYLSADQSGVTVDSLASDRTRMTTVFRAVIMERMGDRPWYKKGLFLARQLLAYTRWRRLNFEAPKS